jgi:hypothetical protein
MNVLPVALVISTSNHGNAGMVSQDSGRRGGGGGRGTSATPYWTKNDTVSMDDTGMLMHVIGRGAPMSLSFVGQYFDSGKGMTYPTEVQAFGTVLRLRRLLDELRENTSLFCSAARPFLLMFDKGEVNSKGQAAPMSNYNFRQSGPYQRPSMKSLESKIVHSEYTKSASTARNQVVSRDVARAIESFPWLVRNSVEVTQLLNLMLRNSFHLGAQIADLISMHTKGYHDGGLVCLGRDGHVRMDTKSVLTVVSMKIGVPVNAPDATVWVPAFDKIFKARVHPAMRFGTPVVNPFGEAVDAGGVGREHIDAWKREWEPSSPLSSVTVLSGMERLNLDEVFQHPSVRSAAFRA